MLMCWVSYSRSFRLELSPILTISDLIVGKGERCGLVRGRVHPHRHCRLGVGLLSAELSAPAPVHHSAENTTPGCGGEKEKWRFLEQLNDNVTRRVRPFGRQERLTEETMASERAARISGRGSIYGVTNERVAVL